MSITIDKVIEHYVKLRDEKSALKAEYEEKAKAVDATMKKLESYLLQQADAQGVTSFKTKAGTAFVTTVDMANVADWDAVLNFIKTHDAWDMLEKRVSKNAVRQYIDATKGIPAGINWSSRLDINVRRGAAGNED